MQYSVPQFVEREQRLLGPLTVRQTVIVIGAGGIIFLLYLLFNNFLIFTLLAIIVSGIALTLAFVQVNGRPLIDFVFYFLNYFLQPRRYTWRKTEYKIPKGGNWSPRYSQDATAITPVQKQREPNEKEKMREIKNLADILNQ